MSEQNQNTPTPNYDFILQQDEKPIKTKKLWAKKKFWFVCIVVLLIIVGLLSLLISASRNVSKVEQTSPAVNLVHETIERLINNDVEGAYDQFMPLTIENGEKEEAKKALRQWSGSFDLQKCKLTMLQDESDTAVYEEVLASCPRRVDDKYFGFIFNVDTINNAKKIISYRISDAPSS